MSSRLKAILSFFFFSLQIYLALVRCLRTIKLTHTEEGWIELISLSRPAALTELRNVCDKYRNAWKKYGPVWWRGLYEKINRLGCIQHFLYLLNVDIIINSNKDKRIKGINSHVRNKKKTEFLWLSKATLVFPHLD